jgi:hypothetical protein
MAAEVKLLNHGKWHPAWQPPVLQLAQFERDTQLPCTRNKSANYISGATEGSQLAQQMAELPQ